MFQTFYYHGIIQRESLDNMSKCKRPSIKMFRVKTGFFVPKYGFFKPDISLSVYSENHSISDRATKWLERNQSVWAGFVGRDIFLSIHIMTEN